MINMTGKELNCRCVHAGKETYSGFVCVNFINFPDKPDSIFCINLSTLNGLQTCQNVEMFAKFAKLVTRSFVR